MAIGRPTPVNLAQISSALTQASAVQTAGSRVEKSYDPNFPVFEVPVNKKLLVYIPNHTTVLEDGTTDLVMDRFLAHPVRDGRSYHNIRCSASIQVPSIGWDGTCPLCNAVQNELWPLYHKEMEALCRSRGLNHDAPETKEIIKPDSKEWLQNRPIREAERWFTFPIVVIETKEGTVDPALDENGGLVGHPCFYSVREVTYNDKWVAGFDTLDTVAPTHPGGLWAILNFTYQPKSGKPDKMGSAKNLKVTYKTYENYAQWAQYFDQMTAAWTPAKAQEVLALDAVRTMDDLIGITDNVMKADRDKANLYNVMGGTPSAAPAIPQSTAEQTLQNFGGAPAIPQSPAPAAPVAPAPTAPATPVAPAPTAPQVAPIPTQAVPTVPTTEIPTVPTAPLGTTPVAPVQ